MSSTNSSDTWFYRERGQIKGPFTRSQMQSLVRRQRVGRHFEVSIDSYQWARAAEFPELFEAVVTRKVRKNTAMETVSAHAVDNNVKPAAHEPDTFSLQDPPDNQALEQLPQIWHYALIDADPVGPIPVAQLIDMFRDGQLLPEDHVWHSGMTDWLPAAQVEVLSPWIPQPQLVTAVLDESGQSVAVSGDKSALAIASMVLGILSMVLGISSGVLAMLALLIGVLVVSILWIVAVIPAIVLGHLALREINRTHVGGRGFAIAGVALGYSSLGITVIGLLLFALTRDGNAG